MLYIFIGNDTLTIQKQVQNILKQHPTDWVTRLTITVAGDWFKVLEVKDSAIDGNPIIYIVDAESSPPATFQKELEAIAPLSLSILILKLKKAPDGRTALGKWLKQQPHYKEFNLLAEWDEAGWKVHIQGLAQQLGVKVAGNVPALLFKRLGSDPVAISNELLKLSSYTNGQPITPADVEALTPEINGSPFKLGEALLKRDTGAALQQLELLRLMPQEPEIKILYALITQFRRWTWVKSLLLEGKSTDQQTAQEVGMTNPKQLYFIRQNLAQISLKELMAILRSLSQCEMGMKTSAPDPLVELVYQVCRVEGES